MMDDHKELERRLAELPTEIQPDRDLWPEISDRMHENGVTGGSADVTSITSAHGWYARRRRHVHVGWAVAASAAFASIVGASVWATMRAPLADQPAVAAAAPGSAGAVDRFDPYDFASAGLAEYEAAEADLQEIIDSGREMLDPRTLTVLEQSIAVIDQAIDEARAALEADPGHEGLRRMLQQNHRRKLGLLRQTAVALQSRT